MTARLDVGRTDLVWNFAAQALFLAAGVVANFVIARAYGPAIAGLFSQTFAFYLIASQFAVFGVHLAALWRVSSTPENEVAAIVNTALAALVIPVTLTMLCAIGLMGAIPRLFPASPGLATSWALAVLGLPFFALNKLLLNVASARGRFRLYANAQAARSVLFLLLCLVWIMAGWPGTTIALAISIAEISLSLALVADHVKSLGFSLPTDLLTRAREMLHFGGRAMPSVAAGDLNTRIDVLVLGLYVAPEAIGIYAIASWIIDGAMQLPVAIRPLINARLAQLIQSRKFAELRSLMNRVGGWSALAVGAALAVIAALLPFIANTILADARYAAALPPLLILSVGVTFAALFLPFDLILVQAGKPELHSALKLATVAVNLVLSLLLVPRYQIIGAATAYAASFAFYGLCLRAAVRRHVETVG